MKSSQAKITELLAKVARLEREVARLTANPARVRIPKLGWWIGRNATVLNRGGSCSVNLYWWDGTTWRDNQQNVTAHDWFLNSGESIAAGTWMRVDWYFNIWVVTNAYCDVFDGQDSSSSALLANQSLNPLPLGAVPLVSQGDGFAPPPLNPLSPGGF